MPKLIGFFILIAILAMVITGALGMYIAGEKGRSLKKGFFIGALFSLFGLIGLSFMKPSNSQIVQDMYDRDMMSLDEYEKTMEFQSKKIES